MDSSWDMGNITMGYDGYIGFYIINHPAIGVPPFMEPPQMWRYNTIMKVMRLRMRQMKNEQLSICAPYLHSFVSKGDIPPGYFT